MILAKLFVLKQEIELLSTDMRYVRRVESNGEMDTEVLGGHITVCFATRTDTDMILRWMTKDSEDESLEELDKMEKGKVCFYQDGFDYPPTKTYDFNDAFLVDYVEVFDADSNDQLQTVMTISPGIQDYGVEIIKPWNVSYVVPTEEEPHQAEEVLEKKLVNYYLTDSAGNKIEEYETGDKIFLVIETKNRIDDKITIHLEDKSHDFKYKGEVLENDKLENYIIKSDLEKIELTVIGQFSQT